MTLQQRHRLRRTGYMAEARKGIELVRVLRRPQIEVGAARDGGAGEQRRQRATHPDVPAHRGEGCSHRGRIGPEFLLQPAHAIAGERFHLHRRALARRHIKRGGVLPSRHCGQGADTQPMAEPAGDLGGAQDGRVQRLVDEVALGAAPRRPADPAGVEEVLAPAAQQVAAFGEEWPTLVEEGLEPAEIHLGRVRFHLPEVGVHGRIQGQVGAQPQLEVGAGPHAIPAAVVERIPGSCVGIGGVGSDVRHDLQPARRPDALDTLQQPEPRRPPRFARRDHHPVHVLVCRRHPPVDLHAPFLHRAVSEAKLRKGNPHLGVPAGGVMRYPAFPDRIPGQLAGAFGVIGVKEVAPHSAAREREGVGGPPVVIGIERDQDVLGIAELVPAGHDRRDLVRIGAGQPGPYIQRLGVVQERHLSWRRWGASLGWHLLEEIGAPLRVLPGGISKDTVDAGLATRSNRRRLEYLGAGLIARLRHQVRSHCHKERCHRQAEAEHAGPPASGAAIR